MKTNIINKLAALLTVSGLSLIAPLTVTAQNLVVSNSTVTASGTHYENVGGTVPLSVSGSLGSFTGGNIIITGTGTGDGARGVTITTQGGLNLTDSVITTNASGIVISNTSHVFLNNVDITTQGSGADYAIITNSSTLAMNGGSIQSRPTAISGANSFIALNNVAITSTFGGGGVRNYGTSSYTSIVGGTIIANGGWTVQIYNGGTAFLQDVDIANPNNYSVILQSNAKAILDNVNINAAAGLRLETSNATVNGGTITAAGIGVSLSDSSAGTLNNVSIITHDNNGHGFSLAVSSTLTLSGTIHTTGNSAYGLNLSGTSVAEFNNANIITEGTNAHGINLATSSTLTMSGGTVAAVAGSVVNSGNGAGNVVILSNVTGSGMNTLNASGGAEIIMTANNSTLTGNLTAAGTSIATLTLSNSELTGSSTIANNAVLTVNLDTSATWTMTADSQITNLALNNSGKIIFRKDSGFKTLTTRNLSGSGIFEMHTDIAAGDADRLIVSGTSAGTHQVRITNHGEQTLGTEPALLVIETADGVAKFEGSVSVGMFDYTLYQDQTDWYLSCSGTNLPPNPPDPDPTPDPDPQPPTPPVPPTPPTPPAPPTISEGGKIVLIVPPSVGQNWFDHNDKITSHFGDLRNNAYSRDDKAGILEALWVKSYGEQLNIAPSVVGSGVREYQYGVDIGSDHRWNLDKDNTLIAGGFVGYGRIDRELRNGFGTKGDTDNYHAGLYAIWLHECGLWADIVAKGQYSDNSLSAWDASQNRMTADYGTWGGGVSLDLGKKFEFAQGWYVEPYASVGYAHLMGNDYTTGGDNIFAVSISDSDLFQFRVGTAFGRTIKLNNSGILQPYIKVAGVEQVSTGGKVKASGGEWRPNFDGARAEIGGGIIWQLNTQHQLSLDYEASFGDKYDKPWGLTAGYRYQF